MKKFDWKWTLQCNLVLLKALGLWPPEDTYSFSPYTIWAGFSTVAFSVGYNTSVVLSLYFALDDLEAFTSTLFMGSTVITALTKTYYLVTNMRTLKRLFNTLHWDLFNPESEVHEEIIRSGLNFWRITSLILWGSSFVADHLLAAFPLLDESFKVYRLPYNFWYPFDTKTSPNYEIVYFYQYLSGTFIALVIMNIDTLISLLNAYIGVRCDILCEELRCIQQDGAPASVTRELVRCIGSHHQIMKFAEEANRFYNWLVLMQFFTSAVCMGVSLFQLTMISSFSSEFVSIVVYFTAIIVEIFIFCWFGNEIILKSSQIPYAAFHSGWLEAPSSFKKGLLILMTKAQRPIKMSAFNLFYLSLETFIRILRAAWSYFALLTQISH